MSFSTLTRINVQLWKCNESSSNNDAQGWYTNVKTLLKETHAYMTDTQKEQHLKKLSEAEKQLNLHLQYLYNYQNNELKKYMNFNPPRKIFDTLFLWELELRQILDKKGLLLKKGERADRAML